jgi:hypothetical protein
MSFLGEQLIIPINSAVTVINKEDNRQFTKPIILEIGHCYRINNRISLRFIGDPDFMALVCVYLNNNAKKSIQDEKELHKYYPRQVHEYL